MARTAAEQIVESVYTGKSPEFLENVGAGEAVPAGTQQAHIANVTLTGTYGDDDDAIETAINAIIAVIEEYKMTALS